MSSIGAEFVTWAGGAILKATFGRGANAFQAARENINYQATISGYESFDSHDNDDYVDAFERTRSIFEGKHPKDLTPRESKQFAKDLKELELLLEVTLGQRARGNQDTDEGWDKSRAYQILHLPQERFYGDQTIYEAFQIKVSNILTTNYFSPTRDLKEDVRVPLYRINYLLANEATQLLAEAKDDKPSTDQYSADSSDTFRSLIENITAFEGALSGDKHSHHPPKGVLDSILRDIKRLEKTDQGDILLTNVEFFDGEKQPIAPLEKLAELVNTANRLPFKQGEKHLKNQYDSIRKHCDEKADVFESNLYDTVYGAVR